MNTNRTGMRTVLAAAAAGALIIGSAAGAMAVPKDTPAPQKNDRVVSVSIKGHSPIDLKTAATDNPGINLRAKLWDPNRDSAATTMKVTMGVYTKKVGGSVFNLATPPTIVDTPMSLEATLTLNPADEKKKVKRYSAAPKVIGDLWTVGQLTAVATALDPNEKAYICISGLTVTPKTNFSKKVDKRLGIAKGKAVRDCVKVIDSAPLTLPAPPA